MRRMTLLLTLLLMVAGAQAAWTLDNDASRLSFVSIKKGSIGEVHTFKQLSGQIGDDGAASLTVELASVDTAIPIRDDRMRQMLFQVGEFPRAVLTGKLDPARLKALEPGDTLVTALEGELSLHGQSHPMTTEILVARLDNERLLVTSYRPLVLNAGEFDLAAGIEKLREIAGLPAISSAVPVSFVLSFKSGM